MPGWQVAQMWFGGLKSHLSAEALWAIMHIDEMGAVNKDQRKFTLSFGVNGT